jgi:hypothetical protein
MEFNIINHHPSHRQIFTAKTVHQKAICHKQFTTKFQKTFFAWTVHYKWFTMENLSATISNTQFTSTNKPQSQFATEIFIHNRHKQLTKKKFIAMISSNTKQTQFTT